MSEAGEGEAKLARRESRFYAVRTIGGRELDVALMLENRVRERKLDIRSILIPPRVKGIVLVEAPASFIVAEAIRGIPYARSIAPGYIPPSEIDKVVREEVVVKVKEGQIVEIISGALKGLRARVLKVIRDTGEVEVQVLDASYNLHVRLSADSVRPLRVEEHGA